MLRLFEAGILPHREGLEYLTFQDFEEVVKMQVELYLHPNIEDESVNQDVSVEDGFPISSQILTLSNNTFTLPI